MRIFITGGTGFIGAPVVKLLQKKGHITYLSDRLENIEEWKEKLYRFNPEVCIHMAWEGIPDFSFEQASKNVYYGIDLFKVIAESGCKKIIGIGTLNEYNSPKGQLGDAKTMIHKFGEYICKNNDIVFIWARIFYAYGVGQREGSLIPYVRSALSDNKDINLMTPLSKHDYIYVDDIADAIVKLIDTNKSQSYDIGSGGLTTNKEIVASLYNITKETGWKPSTSMEEGIRKIING